MNVHYNICRNNDGKSMNSSQPSDVLTEKTTTLKENILMLDKKFKPMIWKDFKELTKPEQIEYLNYIFDEYRVSVVKIAEMFGVSKSTVYNYIDAKLPEINLKHTGGKPYNESQCKWAGFCNGEVDIKTNHANDDVSATDAVLEKVHAKCPDAGTPDADQDNASDINTNGFSMCVAGRIDVNDLCNLLKLNIGSKYGTLTITFEAA